jgi:site-specific DNA-cytosine methylase
MFRVLVACEFSGVVREAFKAKGCYAMSCDLLDTEIPGEHYKGDVRDVLNDGWDLMIAHPPCTFLSVSGMHWTTRGLRDPQLTEDALDFVKLLLEAPIEKICLENPVSVISSRIRKPDQIIQPWMFGHDISKKTCLWLKNLPKLEPTDLIIRNRYSNQTPSGQNKLGPSPDRWKERSKTYQGIAEAMANQWTPKNV